MDFADDVRGRSTRFASRVGHVATEEATKNSMVLPFIEMLGYAIFDPTEVVPEYTADVGIKKGEKVDYAILKNGDPILIFECKRAQSNLDDADTSQLMRYFNTTEARFGVLTNGKLYRFYSDLEKANVMDDRPFFEFNMLDVADRDIEELRRFTKDAFDLDDIIGAARELKYLRELRKALHKQFSDPSEGFVRYFVGEVYGGRITQSVIEQFTELMKQAVTQFTEELFDETVKEARASRERRDQAAIESLEPSEQELEAYNIVRAIVRDVVDVKRVFIRNFKGHCGILLDNTLRKQICKLYLRGSNLRLGLLDEQKQEVKHFLEDLDQLFDHAAHLRRAVAVYESDTTVSDSSEEPSQ